MAAAGFFGVPVALAIVVLPIVYGVYEDTIVGREYNRYFAKNPELLSAAALHIQTAFNLTQAALAMALVVATGVYVSVTRTARDDARAARDAAAEAERRAADQESRTVAALERIATALESNVAGSGAAPQVRALLAFNLGRPQSTWDC